MTRTYIVVLNLAAIALAYSGSVLEATILAAAAGVMFSIQDYEE